MTHGKASSRKNTSLKKARTEPKSLFRLIGVMKQQIKPKFDSSNPNRLKAQTIGPVRPLCQIARLKVINDSGLPDCQTKRNQWLWPRRKADYVAWAAKLLSDRKKHHWATFLILQLLFIIRCLHCYTEKLTLAS